MRGESGRLRINISTKLIRSEGLREKRLGEKRKNRVCGLLKDAIKRFNIHRMRVLRVERKIGAEKNS